MSAVAATVARERAVAMRDGFVTFYACGFPMAGCVLVEDAITLADAWEAGGLTFPELASAVRRVGREAVL